MDENDMPMEGGEEELLLSSPVANEDITGDIKRHMDSLPDEAKNFVIDNLSPEVVVILSMFLGPAAEEFFGQYMDPTVKFVKVPRDQATSKEIPPQPGAVSGGFIENQPAKSGESSGSFI